MPLRKEHILAFAALALFICANHVAVVAHQLSGIHRESPALPALAYFLGVLVTAWGMDVFLRRCRASSICFMPKAGLVLCIFLLPVFVSIAVFFMRQRGFSSPLSDFASIFALAAYTPLCLYFFCSRLPSRLLLLFFPLAFAVGYFLWAVLAPLTASTADETLLRQYFILVNALRIALASALAVTLYLLFRLGLVTQNSIWPQTPFPLAGEQPEEETPAETTQFSRRVRLFLLPLGMYFFMNGISGALFALRLQSAARYPGPILLSLTLLFCLAAWALHKKGTRPLKPALYAVFLFMLATPALLSLPQGSVVYHSIFTMFAVGHQFLLFTAMLLCLLLAPQSRYPVSLCCAVWVLSTGMLLCGGAFARFILPLLPVSQFAAACICSALCLFLLPLLGKVFPLPETPQESFAEGSATDANGQNGLVAPEASAASIAAFAERYALIPREKDILTLLCRKASSKEMLETLGIKESSLRTYISHMLKKTGAVNRVELALRVSGFSAQAPALHPSPADSVKEKALPI